LDTPYVDVVFAHRHDPTTPMEETCRAFDKVIRDGKAYYWSTSEWSAAQIMDAIQLCITLHLHKPIAD